MGTSAKRFLHQHTPHLETTNKHYISLLKAQKIALCKQIARRKALGMDTAAAAMAVWAKGHYSLPSLPGQKTIARTIRGGPSSAPSVGSIAKKTRYKTGV